MLLLMSLLYHHYLAQTSLSPALKIGAATAVVVGVLAQSGGFFLHMAIGQPGNWSIGNAVTAVGAAVLSAAILVLAYDLIRR